VRCFWVDRVGCVMKKLLKKITELLDLHLCPCEPVKPIFSHGQLKGR
jgi:hypothetical protein